jgi:tetratricopeptide (TPR) repeat protein
MKPLAAERFMNRPRATSLLAILLLAASAAVMQSAGKEGNHPTVNESVGQRQQQPGFAQQGEELVRQGKLDDALDVYFRTLQLSPNSFEANLGVGRVLDLVGREGEARDHLKKAIQVAATPEERVVAQRATAISHAFQGNCPRAVAYEQEAFEYYVSIKDFFEQGEAADEAGRICLDSGDLDTAYKWYEIGHDTGLKEPDIKPARVDLWNFRWEHAQARIAARRGQQAEAQRHVAAAKVILDKGTNPQQAQFFPYLMGYVAFYGGDYKTALEELLKANQNDPFIQCLMAQTYEKLGDKDKAVQFYRKAEAAVSHNPAAAYSIPLARNRLVLLRE